MLPRVKPDAPSRTAEYMALFRALETVAPSDERLFDDPAAERFLSPRLRAIARAARSAPVRDLTIAWIDRRYPGPRLSGVVRTRAIDDLVREALADGCEQLVLLGAGYDTRATRLAEARLVRVFEVDHPTTQVRKRDALGMPPAHVSYVPVDFERDDLLEAMTDAGLDAEQRSCVVWEGVFSYLTVEAIDATLAALVRACARGSVVILTYIDKAALEGPESRRAWVTAASDVGEPFKTGLRPSQASEFFAARGLELRSDESTAEAGLRLGVQGARAMPGSYRLATLEVMSERDLEGALTRV